MEYKEEDFLNQLRALKMSEKDLLGRYEKPQALLALEQLQANKEIDTEAIGLQLYGSVPFTPAPVDVIPFAHTGGDGCYVGFITDFGFQDDLENAPIAFISPADFDQQNPKQGNFLIAGNIKEFLSCIISLKYIEIVRFKDIYTDDLQNDIMQCIKDRKEIGIDMITTPAKIKHVFNVPFIDNFPHYFRKVRANRVKNTNVETIDGLRLLVKGHIGTCGTLRELDVNAFANTVGFLNLPAKLKAIRDAPYLYPFFKDEYATIKTAIASDLEKEGFKRESRIINFEIKKELLFKRYLEIRREKRQN